jgi:hypothetical protein
MAQAAQAAAARWTTGKALISPTFIIVYRVASR